MILDCIWTLTRLDVIVKSIPQRDRKFVCVTSRSCEKDRLNRCVIEGQMIGAHSRRTRLVMRGCAVDLEMGRCWRVRRTVNSGMGRKSKIGCFSGRGNGAPFRCSGGAVEVHWLAKYLANRVAFSKSVVAISSPARRSGMTRCGVEIFANCCTVVLQHQDCTQSFFAQLQVSRLVSIVSGITCRQNCTCFDQLFRSSRTDLPVQKMHACQGKFFLSKFFFLEVGAVRVTRSITV